MIGLLLYIIVLCVVFGLAWYVVRELPLDPPFARVARVVISVLFVLALVYLLLAAVPGTFYGPRLP